MVPAQQWLPLFESFIQQLRITSKEVASLDERGAPLDLWGSQRMALEQMCLGLEKGIRSFLILKARQLGISTVYLAIDIFWLAVHPGTIGALVTDTEQNRAIFRETVEKYIASFPKGYLGKKFTIVKANKEFLLFSNGSRLDLIVAGTKNKTSWGEGRGYALAHLTEVANYGSEDGLASFRETLAEKNPNRLFIYESTAKGFNHYKSMWDEFRRDTFSKMAIFIGWWSKEINEIHEDDPRFEVYGLDPPDDEERELIRIVKERYNFDVTTPKLAWYRWRNSDQSSSESSLHQNLPWTPEQAFVQSGSSFFQIRLLQKDMERCEQFDFKAYRYWLGNDFWSSKMEHIIDYERIEEVQLRVWEEPEEGAMYSIGCDPAYGRNDWKDRHAITVWRCFADRMVQVAEYADNEVETRQAAWVLAHLAGAYRNCIVNVELTGGPGMAVLAEFEHLRESMRLDPRFEGTENKNWEDFLNQARWYLYHRPDSMGPGYVKCWQMTGSNKFGIMNQFRDNYSTNLLDIRSVMLVDEMMSVIQNGSEISAPGRQKDDRVFAAVLANRTWIDHIRMPMLASGQTWEVSMAKKDESVDKIKVLTQNIVSNFFKSAEELAQNEPVDDRTEWLRDRGLI